jgi:AcrR family transcriptional regulator
MVRSVPSTTASRRAAPLPPQERRAAIIRAVLPLLVERGEAVTTRELAQTARVSEGTIFKVFADKDELLAAALEAALDPEPFERAVAGLDPSAGFEPQLVEATRLLQHRIVDVWRLVSVLGARHERPDGPLPDSPALTALFASHPSRLTVEPIAAARLLRALTLSLTHPVLAAEPLPAERIVEVLLHGIGARP